MPHAPSGTRGDLTAAIEQTLGLPFLERTTVERQDLPAPERLFQVAEAFRHGMSVDEVFKLSFIDPWFLDQLQRLVEFERVLAGLVPAWHACQVTPAVQLKSQ